jgi:hypothetical protein
MEVYQLRNKKKIATKDMESMKKIDLSSKLSLP